MKQEATIQVITHAVSSHKGAATVAAATAGTGLANVFDLVSDGLGLFAAVCGITLTLILIRKHLFEFKQMKLEAEHQSGRRKEDNEQE